MFFTCFLFIAGLVLVLKGGDWFVGASVRLAELLHMPRVVIGATISPLRNSHP